MTAPAPTAAPLAASRPESVMRRRWRKFKTLKRGWWSFLFIVATYVLTFFNSLLINNKPIVVKYQGEYSFPVLADLPGMQRHYEAKDFGQRRIGEPNWRQLGKDFSQAGEGDWLLMPPYPYHPNESLLLEPHLSGNPPHKPSREHWFGTDDRARDVFARLVYGYRISLTFAFGVLAVSYVIGISAGATFGFFGGRIDIYGQRLVEIWAAIPFLYTVIIIRSMLERPGILFLMVLLAIFNWVGISYYMRGEFYREKARDYVAAAIAQGESRASIMFRHILPNALTPVISFAPFAVVGDISALVALDFLGFGLTPPTPSWGELVNQGLTNIFDWHLVLLPLGALFVTLILIVFVGEAIREAFDPKVFARLR